MIDVESIPLQRSQPKNLYEAFTGYTLPKGQWRLGVDIERGFHDRLTLGTDIFGVTAGIFSLSSKFQVFANRDQAISVGLKGSYLNPDLILWGQIKDQFDEISAAAVRPSASWSLALTPGFNVHQMLAIGFGQSRVVLSEQGKQKLFESKNPGEDYEGQARSGESSRRNQESNAGKISKYAERTIQFSTIASALTDQYQCTLEFVRQSGNRLLLSFRHQQVEIEDLKASGSGLTLAHHWMGEHLQLRLGFGAQFAVTQGYDLDGEKIAVREWQPATDMALYWLW